MEPNAMKKTRMIKDGLLVTLGSVIAFLLSFALYYLIFLLLRRIVNEEGSYPHVSILRIGYGILWIIVGILVFRSHWFAPLKASAMTGALTTFFVTIGINLYKTPMIAWLIIAFFTVFVIIILYKLKKEWIYYYSIGLSIIASLLFLLL